MSGVANIQRGGKPVAGAGPRNQRALKHAATSEQRLAPLREALAVELRADYPHLDGRRLAILADRLARMESARRWLDERGGVVRNRNGEVYPVVDRVEKWSGAAERLLAAIEAEARTPIPVEQRLRDHLEAKAG